MRIGVFSDVHGNIYALEKLMEEYGFLDYWIFCGDYSGYYYHLEDVVGLIKSKPGFYIRGNHDDMLLTMDTDRDKANLKEYASICGTALERSMKSISKETTEWMHKQKTKGSIQLDEITVGVYHGSPWDSSGEYVYPDSEKMVNILELEEDVIILGHTHIPYCVRDKGKIIINPGSVGQPRDYDPRLSFGIFDTISREYENVRLIYDVSTLQKEVEKYDSGNKKILKFLTRKQ